MRYRAVLFDVGETLVGPRESFGATYARVLAPLGLERPIEVFDQALRATWDEMDRRVVTGQDRYAAFPGGERGYWLEFVRGVIRRIDGGALPSSFAERVLDALRDSFKDPAAWNIYPDAVPTLLALRRRGLLLAVVSNWDSRLPQVLELLKLRAYFHELAVSSLVGLEKPDPRIFRHALERLGVAGHQALHVGDLPEIDLAGAQSAGLDAVLVDRHGRLDGSVKTVRDLREVLDLVD